MIDAEQDERKRCAEALRFLDRVAERRDQLRAVEFAGQRIVLRQLEQFLIAGAALGIDSDDALHALRLAVMAGDAASSFFDPDDRRRGSGADPVFDPVRCAGRRLRQGIRTDRAGRLDQFCKPGTCRPGCRGNVTKDRGGVFAP